MGVRAAAIRVAIVDDERLVLDGLSARLSQPSNGIDVVASETSWSSFLDHPGLPVDVVVLDLYLDDRIPVGTKLRALDPEETATVVMSSRADDASVSAAISAGALGFIPKTESADELVAAIKAAARGRSSLTPEFADVVASFEKTPDAGLGEREQHAIVLYANGHSIKEVAVVMGTTEETVKSYIKRSRRKYKSVGLDVGTRVALRRHGLREGWVRPE